MAAEDEHGVVAPTAEICVDGLVQVRHGHYGRAFVLLDQGAPVFVFAVVDDQEAAREAGSAQAGVGLSVGYR
ncbi:hypothetical protein [Actinomadura verrucosospora]|uniref:hypothetical protein n=1 Tax=Actinomadura verrucosospora TaxID=46165 RepID=UPI0015639DB0|nr:hypothetical protein [Actinomadura verrucosospora]